ncbi:MAG: hypothetical protein HYV28_11620 [Ignavibacteriales bacterium]|nr:hypothetical protein [Ignavibacteriales bacterium]
MTRLRNIISLLIVSVFCMYMLGCKEDQTATDATDKTQVDSAASKSKSDLAYLQVESEMNKMINGNYTTPSQYDQLKFNVALASYNEAIALNPGNTDALFGAAVAQILAAYSDPAINKLLKDMDSSSKGNSASIAKLISCTLMPVSTDKMSLPIAPAAGGAAFMMSKALTDPPLVSRVQAVLRDNFLPKVQAAIDNLGKLEANETFKFIISGTMQGDPQLKSISIYPTEAALFNAMLNMLKFNIQCLLVYKFDLTDYKQATLLDALKQSNTTFFTLQTDGKQRAADAKASFSTSIGKIKKAIDFLKRISGAKSDAIIKLGTAQGSVRQSDLDTLTTYLNKVESALNSDLSVEIKDADTDGNSYTIKVNLGNFLTNPPANPKKDLLPAYTVSASGPDNVHIAFDAATYATFNFPDPTMGGLFPGMQQETLKRIMRIDEDYAFILEGYVSIRPFWWYSFSGSLAPVFKIYTASGSYQAKADEWGYFRLFVRDAGTTTQAITKYAVTYSGQEYELANVFSNQYPGVKAKEQVWSSVSIILQPVSLTATYQTSPYSIQLAWSVNMNSPGMNTWSSAYRVQRRTPSTGFTDLQTLNYWNYSFSTSDENVTSGETYTYRIRSLINTDELSSSGNFLYLMPKNILYSNEVTITTPSKITGTFVSEGSNLSTLLKSQAYRVKKLTLKVESNGAYTITQIDSSNITYTFTGVCQLSESSNYDYSSYSNTYGAKLYNITFTQANPTVVTSTGIVAFGNNTLTYECVQTSPQITGVTAPTAAGGFGSSLYNGTSLNGYFVVKCLKQ